MLAATQLVLGGVADNSPATTLPAVTGDAYVSADGLYRYWLRRKWADGGRVVCWIGLNPSVADADRNDPTVKLLIRDSFRWGYDEMLLLNANALISTDPKALTDPDHPNYQPDPVGPENARWLAEAGTADLVIAAWGAGAGQRGVDVAQWLLAQRIDLHCLGLTKAGAPWHPGRKPIVSHPIKFRVPGEGGQVPCWHCVTPWPECLDEINRTARRCCEGCEQNRAHQPIQ